MPLPPATRRASLSKHPLASLQAPGSSQADTLTPFFVEHLMPVRCVKSKLFFFQGGSEFTYLPKQQSANKASCIQSKTSANNWGGLQLKRGKSASSPTPPNSTQSKPNTKAFCSVFEVKIPWHFSLFDDMLLTEVKTVEIC